jgi:hypothetical protein
MVPRRNPELVVAVLQEHGDWGSNSAKIAAKLVALYVEKKRRQEHNLMEKAGENKPVEVGAVWSDPKPAARGKGAGAEEDSELHGGHFFVDPEKALGMATEIDPKSIPQGLKPDHFVGAIGTTEVVPCYKAPTIGKDEVVPSYRAFMREGFCAAGGPRAIGSAALPLAARFTAWMPLRFRERQR